MKRILLLIVLTALLLVSSLACSRSQDKRELVVIAQAAYYSLPKNGLKDFQCSFTPDWRSILEQETKTEIKSDNPALNLLNGVHFWVSISGTGKAKLTHQVDSNPTSMSQMDDFQKAIGGVEETVDGFWRTASIFLLTSALPASSTPFELSERDGSYILSYRENGYEVVTTLEKDYEISEIKVKSATISSSLRPKFTKTDLGFLLSSYEADYSTSGGAPLHISVRLKYQDVDGLHLPSDLVTQSPNETGSHEMRLHFADYEIKRR
jgi:hypothetical protein